MTKLEALARDYVEEKDYIFDENREIAGKAFLAGFALAVEWLRSPEAITQSKAWAADVSKFGSQSAWSDDWAQWLLNKAKEQHEPTTVL